MANRFFNPNEQFSDSTGLPYAGGTLGFFASGTSTPLNTYSDSALSIANTIPVVLDSAGRANTVFLQNLAYKVVLSDVNNNLIWTEDPVYASDYSTRAKLTSGSGSPNGSVAGTAGSAGIGADTYWDNVNNILYVCTTTGNAATAVWTAVNATAAAAIVPTPQGYLTPISGTPIIPSDSIAATSLVYTPYVGNIVPVFNGAGFTPTVFSELTLTLTSSQAASTLYDVFVFNNLGVLTLVTGPAWSSSTAGSCSRGSGASTTALSRLNGIWVNAVQISGRNGATTYTIAANQATYLGSLFMDIVAGQVTCHRSFGQSRKWGIWNAYNRTPTYLSAGDSASSWLAPTNATFRPSNGNTANSLTIFSGLPEEVYDLKFNQAALVSTTNTTNSLSAIGIGVNATAAPTGLTAILSVTNSTSSNIQGNLVAAITVSPSLGINVVTALERSPTTNGTSAFLGTAAEMLLSAQWRV